jgi:phage gp29-like protein
MANREERTPLDFAALFNETKIHQIFDSLNKFYDPDTTLAKIGGRKKLRPLMHDDQVYGSFETRFDSILGLEHELAGEDNSVTEFIKEAIGKKCLEELIEGALMALPYGYNVTELVYEQDGSGIILSKALNKPFEHYQIDRYANVYEKRELFDNEEAPYAKYVLTRHRGSYQQPYGEAILSRLYYAHTFRCHGWEFYIKFLEKFGHPFIHGKLEEKPADPITGETNLQAFAKALDAVRRPTAVVTGMEAELNLFAPPSTGGQFGEFVKAVNKRIQIVILGQTLTSDNSDGGSNALGQVHNLVRKDKLLSDKRMVQESVNKVIGYLGLLNEIPEDRLPKFTFIDNKTLAADRAARDQILNSIGVKFTKEYLQESYDLKDTHFDVSTGGLDLGLDFNQDSHDCYKFNETPEQEALRSLQEDAADQTPLPVDQNEIEAIVASATNKADLEKKLADLIGRGDTEFTQTLTEALFQAQVKGFVDADKKAE